MTSKLFPILLLSVGLPAVQYAQTYRVVLSRKDSIPIVFNMQVNKQQWVIQNAAERLKVDSIIQIDDSLSIDMPFFDSRIKVRKEKDGVMQGYWYKGTTAADAVMPFTATPGVDWRFKASKGNARYNITGRFAVEFTRPDKTKRFSVAEFKQTGNKLTGTFLNPSGDYRFLEGIVTGDSLMLSCFDGSHAYYFDAKIISPDRIVSGGFYAGLTHFEPWEATRNANATVETSGAMMYLKEGEDRIFFRYPDLDSTIVSIRDDRFKGKVVVVQLMGSWCPNCMDETAFLSTWYKQNKQRGVEVVALAYEYSADFHKAAQTLKKFQQRHQVEYPMLNTGVTSSDPQRTEKTLPQFTPIKVFPTTIFIGKDGRVKKVHAGFSGPGTGSHYEEFKKEFNLTIDQLLKSEVN
ncbi:MAG: TlpA disulfide reductase family protein [Sphingobacteriales bacterium]